MYGVPYSTQQIFFDTPEFRILGGRTDLVYRLRRAKENPGVRVKRIVVQENDIEDIIRNSPRH
jgi:hypothetical protein